MLDNTLTITYGSESVALEKINQDSYSSVYYGESGNDKIEMSVKHQIPQRGGSGESHMMRLDVHEHNADGIFVRTTSSWTVVKTFDNVQDTAQAVKVKDSIVSLLGVAGLADSVIGRES